MPTSTDRHGVRPELAHLLVAVEQLRPYPDNAKLHDDDALQESLRIHGQYRPITYQQSTGYVLTGNGTYAAALALGWSHIAATPIDCTAEQARRIVLVDNRAHDLGGGYDDGLLAQLLTELDGDFLGTGYDDDAVAEILGRVEADSRPPGAGPNLAERFLIPPFTVLDARQGWWRQRKRTWIELGIASELGRDDDLLGSKGGNAYASHRARRGPNGELIYEGERPTTSIFDPVLCEVAYRWWCPPGGAVLDPYAGGSVRGIVAARLGLHYTGIDLRAEQVDANRAQLELLDADDPKPRWLAGDCAEVLPDQMLLPDGWQADFLFTCPPYHDLEVYSDDPRDLSRMDATSFDAAYREHLRLAVERLAPHRFAAIVVGNSRDRHGHLRDLGALTVSAMEAAGARFYNDAMLLTAVGSLPLRAAKHFQSSRVLGRTHQQVLVFVKGDRKRAAEACGQLDLSAALDEVQVDYGELGLPELPDPPAEPAPRVVEPASEVTPVELAGEVYIKRDDLYVAPGTAQPGGKARTCYGLMSAPGVAGVTTAGSRQSPQVNIVAGIAEALGLPCRVHVPGGAFTPELEAAAAAGAEVVQHRAGRNNVIIARAREDAASRGWLDVPFGMECDEAVEATAAQLLGTFTCWPAETATPERLVVPVGSGMSLAGILHGVAALLAVNPHIDLPVLGVVVGADPTKRLDRWAPTGWRDLAELAHSELDYHDHAPTTQLGDVPLDPVYEAKCLPFLQPGDLLWVVGRRATLEAT